MLTLPANVSADSPFSFVNAITPSWTAWKPVAMGFFGGCYDFNKMSWFFKKTLSSIRPKLESAGYKETRAGAYDLRDINEICDWANKLASN